MLNFCTRIRIFLALWALLIVIAMTACGAPPAVVQNAVSNGVQIEIKNLPSGSVDSPYNVPVNAKGGATPYRWKLVSGSLPAGLALATSTGVIAGTPNASGQYSFTVEVSDSSSPSETATQALTLPVSSASTSGPLISVTPGSLTFGNVTIDASVTQSLTISNPGSASLSITAASVTGSAFSTSGTSVPLTVVAGGSVTIPVKFVPSTSGGVTGGLSLASNAPTSPTMITLTGSGVASGVTPLQITTTTLPAGQVQSTYAASLAASGGTAPYSWSLSSGSLPAGLLLSASSGAISGSPTQFGSFSLDIEVKDSSTTLQTATKALSLSITPASSSGGTGNTIPLTLFGMAVTYDQSWPTVPFGDLKGNQLGWPYIEQTQGVYNWSNLDSWVSVANAHNVPFHYSTAEAPPWAVSDQTSCNSGLIVIAGGKACSGDVTDLTSWNNFVTALTQRYNGQNGHGFIAVYELYNEPEGFFTGDTANLVAQTVALYKAVRANSPTSLVVGMGVTYPDSYYAPGNYMDAYWAAGGVKTLDAVAFHGYAHHANDVPEIVNTFVPYITAAMARNGIPATTPIWDLEGSWGDVEEVGTNPDSDQQAAWVARSYLLHWSDGVSRFDWYTWGGYPWGALWISGSGIDQAGVAYGQVESWMVGATMSKPCSASGTVWTCGLTKPGSTQTLAVWNTAGSSAYTPAAQYQQYQDLSGKTSAITGGSVTIGIEPILLEQ